MVTITMTEFNRNPSRVTSALESGETDVVRVTKRGVPAFEVKRIEVPTDPIEALIAAGKATPPKDTSRLPIDWKPEPVPPGVDLLDELERDRNYLDYC
ncbi:MAG: type II toxin-antitoxin system Phd/YefM family antitoxin [Propionibacteriaceae bacterium]|nr:type II toxin-antitoxin system Phd/YefM family antitoxin [Propionibacteriaceae bacterium]